MAFKEGFEDVAQLHGGIATYGKDPETKGEYWDGKMYVFDDRISVDINQVEKTIIGKDWFDGKPCERYINCANPECNKQILVSEENETKYLGACSYECAKHERNRYVQANNISDNEWQQRLTNFDDLHQHVVLIKYLSKHALKIRFIKVFQGCFLCAYIT